MNSIVNRYATPATFGLFAVSAISGTALFFHVGQGLFHEMHEWLSVVLLVPFALHLWKNWTPLVAYLRRRTLLWPCAASLALAAAFALPSLSGEGHGEPPFQAIQLMTEARLTDLAPVLKTTPDPLQASLRRQGYPVKTADDTLGTVATAAGVPAARLLEAVIDGRS